MKLIDMTGMTFERLKVIKRVPRPAYHSGKTAWWLCKCRCGKYVTVNGMSLRNGRTKSCGCLALDRYREYCRNKAASRLQAVLTEGKGE